MCLLKTCVARLFVKYSNINDNENVLNGKMFFPKKALKLAKHSPKNSQKLTWSINFTQVVKCCQIRSHCLRLNFWKNFDNLFERRIKNLPQRSSKNGFGISCIKLFLVLARKSDCCHVTCLITCPVYVTICRHCQINFLFCVEIDCKLTRTVSGLCQCTKSFV